MQLTAEAVLRDTDAAMSGEEVLQQRHGPIHGLVAPILGPMRQRQAQPVPEGSSPQRRAAWSRPVVEGLGSTVTKKGVQPIVNTLAADCQRLSHLSHGGTGIDLQDGEGAPIEPDGAGLAELRPQALALGGCQEPCVHGQPPPSSYRNRRRNVKKLFRTHLGQVP
jgi:hypothetical protein